MLFLTDTNDKLQLVSSTAATLDVVAAWIDVASGAGTPGKSVTAIGSATTTDIVAAPSGSNIRTIKAINVRNRHASLSCDVTILLDDNGTDYELVKATLLPGDVLQFVEGVGWYVFAATQVALRNASVGAQGAGFSSDTYLTGSNISIPSGQPVAKTIYRCTFDVVKTGAGTVTPIVTIRIGTAGTTADTARCTLTFNAGTANADTGEFTVTAVFRSVGSGTAAVLAARAALVKGATATTGLVNLVGQTVTSVSSGFDSTVANSIIGCSFNGGTSFSGTVQVVESELMLAA